MKNVMKILQLFILISVLFLLSLQPSFSRNLKFVQLSDVHYSDIREDNSYKLLSKSGPLLEDAVGQINKIKNVDFIVITGDITDQPREVSLYKATNILNKLHHPWYYVIGNHDTDPNGEITKSKLIEILKKQNKKYKFNSTYYTYKPKKGYRVIVLDGALEDKTGSNGFLPKVQLEWLDNILAKSTNDVVLIFIHFPVLEPFESANHRILNVDEVKTVLKKYQMPIAVFSGHYHTTKIKKRGNILHVSTPSLVGYPNAFRLISIKNKRNKVEFKFDFLETGLKDFQAKTKIMTLGGAIYYGKPSDRDAVIIIDKK